MTFPNLPILAAQAAQGFPIGQFLPFILIFAIFYFMMIRPQQRKDKERRKQIEELRAGARIIFAGGVLGTIVEAKQATFRVEIAQGVVIEVARGAVNRMLKDGEAASLEEPR
jgi:preprotein translocase subunit YajC